MEMIMRLEERVAQRFLIKTSCEEASREIISTRVASSQLKVRTELGNPIILASFFDPNIKMAFGGIVAKAKELWNAFKSYPDKWEEFKAKLGLAGESTLGLLRSFPKKMKEFWNKANVYIKKTFAKAGAAIVKKFPQLEIFFKIVQKLPSVTSFFKNLLGKFPKLKSVLDSIGSKATSLANTVDGFFQKNSLLQPANWFARGAFFTYVWMNVAEISWNIPEIVRGMLGGMSWGEILDSLPESGLGLVVALLFGAFIPFPYGGQFAAKIGLNALLPMALAFQIWWLLKKGYAYIKKGILYFTDKIRTFGIDITPDLALPL
jgi:hypothetical protein